MQEGSNLYKCWIIRDEVIYLFAVDVIVCLENPKDFG